MQFEKLIPDHVGCVCEEAVSLNLSSWVGLCVVAAKTMDPSRENSVASPNAAAPMNTPFLTT